MLLMDLGRSFRYAWSGICRSLREERNFRIHLTAVVYVTALGLLAGLTGPEWAAILLCFGSVLRAELVNTAVENLCDAVHPGQDPKIGAAKDAAAGAVLVLALVSVCVAVILFGPWLLDGGLLDAARTCRWLVPAFLFSLVPAVLFVWLPSGRKG